MYGAKEVMAITGYEEAKSREIIRNVQDMIKDNDNPNYISLKGRVPIRYFNKYILCIESDESQVPKSDESQVPK